MPIAHDLRAHIASIAERWEAIVCDEVPALRTLPRGQLIDHLPEFLEGLAGWIEGDLAGADEGFRKLAEGHALQRHSAGIELEAVTSEYAMLRRVMLEQLLEVSDRGELAASLVRLDAGMDRAIGEAVRRYTAARDHVRERFIGILGHDLRDPLSAVILSATMLSEMTLGTTQAQLVDRITRGARWIERMIDDLLDFARGRLSGGIPISPVLADMGAVCSEAVEEARALGANREIKLELAGDLRGMWDRDRVRQAVANLLSNARQYGKGDIVVRVWERDEPHAVVTSVRNQGSIIPPDVIGRLFDPFARGYDQSQSRRGGLGLGLYIVEQIALAHGGGCTASSTDEGTELTIEWPRLPLEQTPGRELP